MAATNGHGAGGSARNGVVVPRQNGRACYAEKYKLADHFIGGHKLENAPPSKVKDFVASHDGHTVITNVRQLHSNQMLFPGGIADPPSNRF